VKCGSSGPILFIHSNFQEFETRVKDSKRRIEKSKKLKNTSKFVFAYLIYKLGIIKITVEET
jgi:hypothetical protein